MVKRIEKDSFGEIEVDSDKLWGAQTERSLHFFNISDDKMPKSLIQAFGLLKGAAAKVNLELGVLSKEKAELIQEASLEISKGHLLEHFPLKVWQTGSGTQTNMNVNEVIVSSILKKLNKPLGDTSFIHPNDDVNKSQSSNDTFPTAMHIAAAKAITSELLPELHLFQKELQQKSKEFLSIVKIGRTHLMDAVPITLGQEFSGYSAQIQADILRVESTLPALYELAIGGTAVGTGLNCPKGFAEKIAKEIAIVTKLPFISAPNKFAALSSHDPFVFASGALKTLSCSLMKIANDIRWMGSGPRAGLSELYLPENEPGSSIMPGKVNPTQCEAMTMVAIQVIGNDTAITMAGSQGNFELNVFKPLIIYNFLHSVELLTHAMKSFRLHLLAGLKPNKKKINEYLENSLMLVTALTPKIGYDRAAKVAKRALKEDLSLKQAALLEKVLTEEEFDLLIDPSKMV